MKKSPILISKFSVVLKFTLVYLTPSEDTYLLFRESAIKENVPKEEYDKMWGRAEILGKYDISLDKDIKNTILMLYHVEMESNDIMRSASKASYYYLESLLDESEEDMRHEGRNKRAFSAREFLLECKNWIRRDLYNIYCSVLGNSSKIKLKLRDTSRKEINENSNSTDLDQLEEEAPSQYPIQIPVTPLAPPTPIQIPVTPIFVSTPIQSMMSSFTQVVQPPIPVDPHTSNELTFHNVSANTNTNRMPTKQRNHPQTDPTTSSPETEGSSNNRLLLPAFPIRLVTQDPNSNMSYTSFTEIDQLKHIENKLKSMENRMAMVESIPQKMGCIKMRLKSIEDELVSLRRKRTRHIEEEEAETEDDES